jgi:NADPH-dependent 2,4-dienoyl-CoA reductase/sulfur reductase-like enzyme
MSSGGQQRFEVLVVGGGPAGMATAARAAECGVSVGLVDDNPGLGGQIWRGQSDSGEEPEAAKWAERLRSAGAVTFLTARVFHQPQPGLLLAESADQLYELRYSNLVLATGARERFLPFPGWTLPNVMGAGALQAMVKCGLPVRGKRVVVAGSGPLLLAVAASLHRHGAEIPIICEQAPWKSLFRFGLGLSRVPKKISQAIRLRRELSGVPFVPNCWPVAAQGQTSLEGVVVSRGGSVASIPCDYLACGFHLVPNLELPMLVGCAIDGGYVQVDEFQRTSVPSVFCAGEPTGIGGVELAVVEGQIAGLSAAGRSGEARILFPEREKLRSLRPQLRRLSSEDTIVCRCEDVTYQRLQRQTSWRSAKLQTRCGMGPCQGRVCGPATQFLFNWTPESVRPPVFPVRVESLAAVGPARESIELTGAR